MADRQNVTFHIDYDDKYFSLNKEQVSACSPKLHRIIEDSDAVGPFLFDVEVETFSCFTVWLSTDDYVTGSVADPVWSGSDYVARVAQIRALHSQSRILTAVGPETAVLESFPLPELGLISGSASPPSLVVSSIQPSVRPTLVSDITTLTSTPINTLPATNSAVEITARIQAGLTWQQVLGDAFISYKATPPSSEFLAAHPELLTLASRNKINNRPSHNDHVSNHSHMSKHDDPHDHGDSYRDCEGGWRGRTDMPIMVSPWQHFCNDGRALENPRVVSTITGRHTIPECDSLFTAHAKIYMFARTYQIINLISLAGEKLKHSLMNIVELSEWHITAIVECFRIVFVKDDEEVWVDAKDEGNLKDNDEKKGKKAIRIDEENEYFSSFRNAVPPGDFDHEDEVVDDSAHIDTDVDADLARRLQKEFDLGENQGVNFEDANPNSSSNPHRGELRDPIPKDKYASSTTSKNRDSSTNSKFKPEHISENPGRKDLSTTLNASDSKNTQADRAHAPIGQDVVDLNSKDMRDILTLYAAAAHDVLQTDRGYMALFRDSHAFRRRIERVQTFLAVVAAAQVDGF